MLKTEQAKDKAVENSNKLVQELKHLQVISIILKLIKQLYHNCLQDELAKLNQRFSSLTRGENEPIYANDMSNLLESLDYNIMK